VQPSPPTFRASTRSHQGAADRSHQGALPTAIRAMPTTAGLAVLPVAVGAVLTTGGQAG
jgi:hypothetical protein